MRTGKGGSTGISTERPHPTGPSGERTGHWRWLGNYGFDGSWKKKGGQHATPIRNLPSKLGRGGYKIPTSHGSKDTKTLRATRRLTE